MVSRSETSGGNRGGLLTGLALQDLAILGLAGVALAHRRFPQPDLGPAADPAGRPARSRPGRAGGQPRPPPEPSSQPIPQLIQKTVKTGILTLVWLHVGVVAAVRGPEPAALIALCWVPAYILGRWLYST